jgi:phosphatidylinositol alpha-1,6-mannosyltransferase
VNSTVLLLAPSCGLGGGIERYTETLEWAFAAEGVEYRRVDLHHADRRSRIFGHARMLTEARMQLQAQQPPTRLVVMHRALLPVASVLALHCRVSGITVVCHGSEVWGARPRIRRSAESYLMRRPGVRAVAAGSFTSGALSGQCVSTVLPPGLSLNWFQTLVAAAARTRHRDPGIHLVTAFRLRQWRDKGLPELLDAVAALGRPDVRVTVCGSGEPPPELRQLAWQGRCRLCTGLTDESLADELASADLFVLATRTRRRPDASGEGFGLVLLEAQIAGTPVVGPAYGGSHDAYVDRITGLAPPDETAESLARVLDELLKDPSRLAQMGKRAAEWGREGFLPERYARLAVTKLL